VVGLGIGHADALKTLGGENPDKGKIPRRVLGKTGVHVSSLAFGCGSVFLKGYPSDEAAIEALELAYAAGVTYFDTAHNYGDGESERRLGLFSQNRRDTLFLATKIEARDRDAFLRQFELSLKRLRTDRVDLLHIHGLHDAADLSRIRAPGGVYDGLMRLKEQKATRLTGFSCHTDGEVAASAIKELDFDCCMLRLNAADSRGFETKALPAALDRSMGVLAMKATAQGVLLKEAPGTKIGVLLNYVWSLPVSAIVIGMHNKEMVQQNAQSARNFCRMSEPEARDAKNKFGSCNSYLDEFYKNHSDST
jgi:predicted aldo/keto reductase-like oxidoreductase